MMIAYATDYAGECTSTEGLHQTLEHIARAGFSHVHWCHEWCDDYTYSKPEMLQIRGWMNDLGLGCKGLHATEGCRRQRTQHKFHYRCADQNRRDYTSENEYNRMAGVELIRNRIELADVLGADAIVLHMQLPYKSFEQNPDFRERYFKQVFKSLDELEEECLARGVRICIENMMGTPNFHQIDQFNRLFNRYSSDFLAFCLDTGHALVTGEDPLEFARLYQQRLYMMHLSDNHGLTSPSCWEDGIEMSCCDEHKNPFHGTFDWDGFARIVAASPYQLPVVLEVCKRDADEQSFLQESLESGRRFTEMVLKYRESKEDHNAKDIK